MDLGSIIDKNYKLFSSYDYATFDFKPALKEDFFYKWNKLNPYHKNYDKELAEVYYEMENQLSTEKDKEYDSVEMEVRAGTQTIIEESESSSTDTVSYVNKDQKSLEDDDLFCKPKVVTKVTMNPQDPVEIENINIWILHLDGFQYEIQYNRRKKEFLLKDDRVNWINEYFVCRRKKEVMRKRKKKKVKLGDLLAKEDFEGKKGSGVTIEGTITDANADYERGVL
jgi:hypothetical protein